MSEDNAEIAGRGEPGGEADWHDPPQLAGGGVHGGRKALRRARQENFEATWVEFRLEPQQMIPSGDLLFVHAMLSGRSRHEGLDVSMDVFQVWTFRDGLAVMQEAFLDRDEALGAAGLSE